MRWVAAVLPLALAPWQVTSSSSDIVSVVKEPGEWKIVWGAAEDSVAVANLTDAAAESGWAHLDIVTSEAQPDEEQAMAAGIAEGYLTSDAIYGYYKQFIHKGFCSQQGGAKFCNYIREQFQQNLDWVTSRIVSEEGRSSSYWKMVNLFHTQLDGLRVGWLARARDDNRQIPDDFDATWFAYFINFYPDVGDYIHKYHKDFKEASQSSSIVFTAPSCSAMVKVAGEEVLVGHATWHVYESLGFKMLKRYSLAYHLAGAGAGGGLVPGRTIAMSSYAGTIFSLDDFYVASSGLTVMETTLFVHNTSLLETLSPVGVVWEPARVMAATRLAAGGGEWTELFSRHNSGTYNNHWMVVDHSKVGQARDLLWVLEQLPGRVARRDLTPALLQQSYWASYNRAFFPDIHHVSGGGQMEADFGDWFSYARTPRARIFAEEQAGVTSAAALLGLLRANTHLVSEHGTPRGCSGPVPSAAIASRSDLQEAAVSCSWQQHDFMVGRRAYGATDAKVTSSGAAASLGFTAVAGPSTGRGNQLPPFSWSGAEFARPERSPVDTFNFSAVEVRWSGGEEDLDNTGGSVTMSGELQEQMEGTGNSCSINHVLIAITLTQCFWLYLQ